MKLAVVKYLYYYEVPTLIFCQNEEKDNFLFCLFTEEPCQYIGKKVALKDICAFLEGTTDLRPIYEDQKTAYYLCQYQPGGEFMAKVYRGAIGENLLPAPGLVLVEPEKELANTLKNEHKQNQPQP